MLLLHNNQLPSFSNINPLLACKYVTVDKTYCHLLQKYLIMEEIFKLFSAVMMIIITRRQFSGNDLLAVVNGDAISPSSARTATLFPP